MPREIEESEKFQGDALNLNQAQPAPKQLYRERLKNRKIPRRRPEFRAGSAGAEAAKLEQFSDGGGSQGQWLSDAGKTDS